MEHSAGWIAQAVTGTLHGPDRIVTDPVATDSREAQEGSCYVTRRGEVNDGHDYTQVAIERDTIGVIIERILDLDPRIAQIPVPESTKALGDLAGAHLHDLRANRSPDVITVTGSAGKTTTKDLFFQILSADVPTIIPKLSFNNEVGLPLTVLSADYTTQHVVLEVGASGSDHIAYLTEIIAPDVAVELMVGYARLSGFGSVEEIVKAETELIVDSVPGTSVILDADDKRVMTMAPPANDPVWTFSASGKPEAQIRALNVTRDTFDHARFTFLTPEGRGEVALGVTGVHHVNSALAAISGTLVLGIGLDIVLAAVNGVTVLSPYRMGVIDFEIEGVPFTLIDGAYNANLDSMRAGFAALAAIGQSRPRFAVSSEMLELGEESVELHRAVGDMARGEGVKTFVVLGKDSHFYFGGTGEKAEGVPARSIEEVAALLYTKLGPGRVVLVKGSYGSQSRKVADLLREKGVQR